ncbi:MAG: hypothetical protein CXR30_08600 [Geobacter sp.]|nr:MAG: hypothetical protein CXR30_08600 [Geobacter sp.]
MVLQASHKIGAAQDSFIEIFTFIFAAVHHRHTAFQAASHNQIASNVPQRFNKLVIVEAEKFFALKFHFAEPPKRISPGVMNFQYVTMARSLPI